MTFNITSSTWPIQPAWTTSSTHGWSAPVALRTTEDGSVVAELKDSPHGIYGVGRSLAEAIADLRDAIREFGCVLGYAPCSDHRQENADD